MGKKNRNADFISIARRAIHHPLNPLNLLNPLNPFPAPFYTTCRRKAATTYGAKGPVNPHARQGVFGPHGGPCRDMVQ